MRIKKFEVVLLLTIFMLFTYSAAAQQTQEDIASKLIRLHVVANSDSKEDQALKLKVRDKVIEVVEPLTQNATSREEVYQILEDNMDSILAAAQKEIFVNGYSYPVSGKLTYEYFPSKIYDGFALPAGNYDGIKIKIGKAEGKNWWCVVFPPLCTNLSENIVTLSEEEQQFVTGEKYVVKFKVAEIVSEIKHMLNA